MYERFYGLQQRPFDLTPDPRFLFLAPSHREALSNLRYGIAGRRGVTLLLGDAGTGKTMLVHAALESQRGQNTLCVYMNNPTLARSEFIEFLALSFGFDRDTAASKTRFLFELSRLLLERLQAGELTALIIDEAQDLPDPLLDEVRWLVNLETATEKLLPVILVGQPALAVRLNEPGLRQIKQRIALRSALAPLQPEETAAYIRTRIRVAGGDGDGVFTEGAIRTIHEMSRGIPRTISVICDNALVTGFGADEHPVGRDVVLEVCRDFDVTAPSDVKPDGGPARLLVRSTDASLLARAGTGPRQTGERVTPDDPPPAVIRSSDQPAHLVGQEGEHDR